MKILYTITCIVLLAYIASAQSGSLDPSFGNGGIQSGPVITDVMHGNAIMQQSDGKIIVTGHLTSGGRYNMFIVRYTTQGNFDSTFGVNGIVMDSVGQSLNYGRAILLQPDSSIIVAGDFDDSLSTDFFIKHYFQDGTVDTTFATNGIAITDFGNNSGDELHDICLQPDGRMIITGWTYNGNDKDIALVRYNSDGSLDSTFGINGKISTDILGYDQEANAVTLQADGKIVITGYTFQPGMSNDFFVARYNTDGTPDITFNLDGIYHTTINADDDEGNSLTIQPDGKILIAGTTYNNSTFVNSLLVRLDSMGNLDTTFNVNGIVETDINGNDNSAVSILLQPDGKIILAGQSYSADYDVSLSRFLTNGSIDSTFGINGNISSAIGPDNDQPLAAFLQNDNNILVTGYYNNNGLENLFTARFTNDSLITGIGAIYLDEAFSIFPNPALHLVTIKTQSNFDKIEFIDITGKCILHQPVQNNFIGIDVSGLPKGVYSVRIFTSGNMYIKTFVKIR